MKSLTSTALIEPLAVGWHATKISPFKSGDSVLILGGGPIGISVILALKAKGAEHIIVSEVSHRRREFATKFGASHVIDPTQEDVVKRCKELCDGQGVHVVYDCAGVQAGLDAAVHATRARGTIVNIAIWEKACSIVPNDLTFKERKYMGVATYEIGDFDEVIVSARLLKSLSWTDKVKASDCIRRHETTRDDHLEDQIDGSRREGLQIID
jgi:threonine dehydrogenase-like Zn-dependent dehydrogenase